MANWDQSVDFISVGSGGGGLVAALLTHDRGGDALVIEKRPLLGGSTAMSGGVIWMPNNPLMRAEGVYDSYADGLAYFDAVVGDVGPASSGARRNAFLTYGPQMLSFLQERGVRLVRCPGFPDYYDTRKGGSAAGRSVEPAPYDANELGDWSAKLQPGMAAHIGLVVRTYELFFVAHFNRSPKAFATAARVQARTTLARLRRQNLVTNGASLIAQLLQLARRRQIPVWTDTAVVDLVVEDGRVVGVRAVRDGSSILVQARKGVLLAAGGFGHNAEMRRKYSGDQPNEAQWSKANPGDTGEVLEAAMRLGAKVDLMDEAWWLPSVVGPLAASTLGNARQRPGAIFVDAGGSRFVNEANSYVEVGKAMYARDKEVPAVPCWLVIDDGYRRRYTHINRRPGRFPAEWIESGALKTAPTLEELARQCGIDAKGLAATVERFNQNAEQGADPDFGRGQSAHNRFLGDPGYKPNQSLGPIATPPFYAAQIVPGDVGTCGGLLTNEHAQVLDLQDQPIPGLYATGNNTATVMGRAYLGAGASIANTMVFGYLAAAHAGVRDSDT